MATGERLPPWFDAQIIRGALGGHGGALRERFQNLSLRELVRNLLWCLHCGLLQVLRCVAVAVGGSRHQLLPRYLVLSKLKRCATRKRRGAK